MSLQTMELLAYGGVRLLLSFGELRLTVNLCHLLKTYSNVPGVALYMTSLSQIRTLMAKTSFFVSSRSLSNTGTSGSVLPKLSSHGNVLAGALTRVSVGFILNPFSVLKARFEVCWRLIWIMHQYLFIQNRATFIVLNTRPFLALSHQLFGQVPMNFSKGSYLPQCVTRHTRASSLLYTRASSGRHVRLLNHQMHLWC